MKNSKWYIKLLCVMLILLMAFIMGCARRVAEEEEKDPPANEPVRGGTLRLIRSAGPTAIGHPTDNHPVSYGNRLPALESLLVVTDERGFEGLLAESWNEDVANKRITFKLRGGIKFHDGTELTSEVVKWNYQFAIDKGVLRFLDTIDSIETPDKLTIVFNLNTWHNMIIADWGSRHIFSQAAIEKNGEDWARENAVGTGPFKQESFRRDVGITWVRFEDYWREGFPYLDRIEEVYIPEHTTSAAKMRVGEADMWIGADAMNMSALMKEGFVRQYAWLATQTVLLPNTVDPASPFTDKRLREALEYAIDKQAIVDALGYGLTIPITAISPPGEWGGDKVYRTFNPDKAKELLAAAGYPDGLEINLIAQAGAGGRNEIAEAIVNFLREVGINVTLDIADPGRFFADVWRGNWKDLALGVGGTDVTYMVGIQRWFGHNGVYQGGFKRPQEFIDLSKAGLLARTVEDQKTYVERMVDYIGREALLIPLFSSPSSFLHNGRVHTSFMMQGGTRWKACEMWLEPAN